MSLFLLWRLLCTIALYSLGNASTSLLQRLFSRNVHRFNGGLYVAVLNRFRLFQA